MSGAEALQAVASVTWGTGPYAGGFVIGINGVMTNPTQKYWSYWHGSGGGLVLQRSRRHGILGARWWSRRLVDFGQRHAYATVVPRRAMRPCAPGPTRHRPPRHDGSAAIPPPHTTAAPAPRPAPATSRAAKRRHRRNRPPATTAGSAAGAAPGGPRSLASSGHRRHAGHPGRPRRARRADRPARRHPRRPAR